MAVGFASQYQRLDKTENFPGWARATDFLQSLIQARNCKCIADIGGGANPLLEEDFIKERRLDYSLIDISRTELEKAPSYYNKILADVTCSTTDFVTATQGKKFDLIFSHMFLEHIDHPIQTHKNLFASLNPGGMAVHFFPSPNSIPLTINRLLPESASRTLVRLAQPWRNLQGRDGKFPAYYRMCGNPSDSLRKQFEAIGYTVIKHTGFVGHSYYKRFPLIRDIEKSMRDLIVRSGIPLTSYVLLVLQKDVVDAASTP